MDNDGFVSRDELRDWIRFTQKRYITEDVERQWKQYNPEEKDKITWDEYQKLVYGFLDKMDPAEIDKDSEGFSYRYEIFLSYLIHKLEVNFVNQLLHFFYGNLV